MPQPLSYKDFQNLVCTSAHQYYDYLTQRFNSGYLSSGAKVITVYQFHLGRIPGEYVFETNEKVTFPDACQIWVRGRYVPGTEILTVHSQSKSSHSVRVADTKGYLNSVPSLSASDIQIVSDLRFLIRRLGDFYQAHTFSFLPNPPIDIPPLPDSFTEQLSDEQLHAIDTVFTSPISYISGAPGTGKTKAVLSRCILRYIFAKERIILLAPTNNAVEQMLRGVLPILQDAGIDLECVYRFGTATDEFAKEYPQVVGDKSLDTLLQGLQTQKAFYESQVHKAYELQQKVSSIKAWLNDCKTIHDKVCGFLAQIKELDARLITAAKETISARNDLDNCLKQYNEAANHASTAHADIENCEKSMAQIIRQIKKIKPWFWMKERRTQMESDLASLREASVRFHVLHAEAVSEHDECYNKQKIAKRAYEQRLRAEQDISKLRSNLMRQIADVSSYDSGYAKTIQTEIAVPSKAISAAEAHLLSIEAKLQEAVEQADSCPYEAYVAALTEVKDRLNGLGASAKAYQRKNALVLAGTIDSSLGILSPDSEDTKQSDEEPLKIRHVFLDEAGYTCLAKGMAAFACKAPVTFLGDHKQLPPICEMNRIPWPLAPVCLWELPVAYYTELIYGDLANLYHNCYGQRAEPSFTAMEYCALNTSYRFGSALSDILAKYIYSDKFRGIADAPFEIHFCNAPRRQGPYKNSSQSETNAIQSYLCANPSGDIAILAPYRDQIKFLRSTLPKEYRDNILTVHRSQGCEWDTVILSVVDAYRPYFTDSNLPIGRSVLNTAISRAKRRLVIVCDVAEWSKRPNQLITELIRCGIDITNNCSDAATPGP